MTISWGVLSMTMVWSLGEVPKLFDSATTKGSKIRIRRQWYCILSHVNARVKQLRKRHHCHLARLTIYDGFCSGTGKRTCTYCNLSCSGSTILDAVKGSGSPSYQDLSLE